MGECWLPSWAFTLHSINDEAALKFSVPVVGWKKLYLRNGTLSWVGDGLGWVRRGAGNQFEDCYNSLSTWGQGTCENEGSEWTWKKWLWEKRWNGDRLVTSWMGAGIELGKRKELKITCIHKVSGLGGYWCQREREKWYCGKMIISI